MEEIIINLYVRVPEDFERQLYIYKKLYEHLHIGMPLWIMFRNVRQEQIHVGSVTLFCKELFVH